MRNLRFRPAAFLLEPALPFRLDLTVWALRRRPDNHVDDWDGEIYRRALTLDGKVLEVAVAQTGLPDAPRLEVMTHGASLARREIGRDRGAGQWRRLPAGHAHAGHSAAQRPG